MKAFACGDVVPGCQARWVAPTEDEVLARVAEHARAEHDVSELSPELVGAVRAAMSTVPE